MNCKYQLDDFFLVNKLNSRQLISLLVHVLYIAFQLLQLFGHFCCWFAYCLMHQGHGHAI